MEKHGDLDKLKNAANDAVSMAENVASSAVNKAKDVAGDATDSAKDAAAGVGEKLERIKGALKDEEKTDAALDKAADAVNKVTGGKIADQVEKVRQFADDRLGEDLK